MIFLMRWDLEVLYITLIGKGTVDIDSKPQSLKKIFCRYYEAKLGKIDVWILKLTVDKVNYIFN